MTEPNDDGRRAGTQRLDLLITNVGAILGGTADEQFRIVPGTSIGIREGRIASIGPDGTGGGALAAATIDGSDLVASPGLVSTHNHVFQNLVKGLGDELAVWPIVESVILATAEEMTADEVYVAGLACGVEGLKSGRTALLDFMVGRPEIEQQRAVLRAFRDSGVRGWLGRATRELHHEAAHRDPWYVPLEEALDQITQLATEYDNGLGVPAACPAPGNPRTMTTEGLVRVAEYARDQSCLITIHLAEYDAERDEGVERWGRPTIAKLEEIGFLGPNVVAAHSVLVDDEEIDILARTGTKVSYNPISNSYCGVGVAPIVRMLEQGVAVSIATDGSSVNTQDMLQTLKFGALLQKADRRDSRAVNARDMLRMAAHSGAVALGVPDELGVLAVGRRADLFLWDPYELSSSPVHDEISGLVYAAGPQNVRTVLVGGDVVIEDGSSTRIDERELGRELAKVAKACAKRTGTTKFVTGRRFTPFTEYERWTGPTR